MESLLGYRLNYKPSEEMVSDDNFIYAPIYAAGGFMHNNTQLFLPQETIDTCTPLFKGLGVNVEHDQTDMFRSENVGEIVDVWQNTEGFKTEGGNDIKSDNLWWCKISLDINKFPLHYLNRMGGVSTEFNLLRDKCESDYVYNGITYKYNLLAIEPTGISLVADPKFNVCEKIINSLDDSMNQNDKQDEVNNQDEGMQSMMQAILDRLDSIEAKMQVAPSVENQSDDEAEKDKEKKDEVENQDDVSQDDAMAPEVKKVGDMTVAELVEALKTMPKEEGVENACDEPVKNSKGITLNTNLFKNATHVKNSLDNKKMGATFGSRPGGKQWSKGIF